MAGNDDDSTMQTTPNNPEIVRGDEQEDDNVQSFEREMDFAWRTSINRFLHHLSEEEILEGQTNERQFCGCVNEFIDAYKRKAREIKILRNAITASKEKTEKQKRKIRELENTVSELRQQLGSSVCKDCGEKRITDVSEKLNAMSIRGTRMELMSNETETDGSRVVGNMERDGNRKRPREDEERDESKSYPTSDEEPPTPPADLRCRYASCQIDSLLNMFHLKKIDFCPTKFKQKLGSITRRTKPTCTKILDHLRKNNFLKRIYKCEEIKDGEHKVVLEIAANELDETRQKVGIMTYATSRYNHSVTVYTNKSLLRIYDPIDRETFFKDLREVCYLEIIVLKCDENEEVLIVKEWGKECHVDVCIKEFKELKKPGSRNFSSIGVLDENDQIKDSV